MGGDMRWITNIEDPVRLAAGLEAATQAVALAGVDPRNLVTAAHQHLEAATRLAGHYRTLEALRQSHGNVCYGEPLGNEKLPGIPKSVEQLKASGIVGLYQGPAEG